MEHVCTVVANSLIPLTPLYPVNALTLLQLQELYIYIARHFRKELETSENVLEEPQSGTTQLIICIDLSLLQ